MDSVAFKAVGFSDFILAPEILYWFYHDFLFHSSFDPFIYSSLIRLFIIQFIICLLFLSFYRGLLFARKRNNNVVIAFACHMPYLHRR